MVLAEPTPSRSTTNDRDPERARRKHAVRILKDLPREIRIVDLPESEMVCRCCGGALHHFGDD